MKTSLSTQATSDAFAKLTQANHLVAARYPGTAPGMAPGTAAGRQPIHTVYGGADRFRADIASRLGSFALRALEEYAPEPRAFVRALGLDVEEGRAGRIYDRVVEKLGREPVEDFRCDFEDGYGERSDAEEDGHAIAAAREMAAGLAAGTLPPFVGIRIKPLSEEGKERSARTLDLLVTTLVEVAGASLPSRFRVTLPKITSAVQIEVLSELCGQLEGALGLEDGAIGLELMIESPLAILGMDGRIALLDWVDAARGRCVGVHFGPYDYTASLEIPAPAQGLVHPACDFARELLHMGLAGTGVPLSDGPTTILPVPSHRAQADGQVLSARQLEENRRAVHAAWKLQADHVRHALERGIYQGWDLHPAQLPARYGAVYAFFQEGVEAAGIRLRTFFERAARASLVGAVFDDAATAQGLATFFLRAVGCGALTEAEATEHTGVTLDELGARTAGRYRRAR